MPTDTITTTDLVLLAEFCGHEIDKEVTRFVGVVNPKNPAWGKRWNPVDDANQRDELVEAMSKKGISVQMDNVMAGEWCAAFESESLERTAYRGPVSLGIAVCRAALKVISLDSNANTT